MNHPKVQQKFLNLIPINFPGLLNYEPDNNQDNHKNILPYSNKSPNFTISYTEEFTVENIIQKCYESLIVKASSCNTGSTNSSTKIQTSKTTSSKYLSLYSLRLINNNSQFNYNTVNNQNQNNFNLHFQKHSNLLKLQSSSENSYFQLIIRLHLPVDQLSNLKLEDLPTFNFYYNQIFKHYLLYSHVDLPLACLIAKLELLIFKCKTSSQSPSTFHRHSSSLSSPSSITSTNFHDILSFINNVGSRSNFKIIEDTIGWQNLLPYSILSEYADNTKAIRSCLKKNFLKCEDQQIKFKFASDRGANSATESSNFSGQTENLTPFNLSTLPDLEILLLSHLKTYNLVNFAENFNCRIGQDFAAKINHQISVSYSDTISHVDGNHSKLTKFLGSFINIIAIRPFEEELKLRLDIEGSSEPLVLHLDSKIELENLALLINQYASFISKAKSSLILRGSDLPESAQPTPKPRSKTLVSPSYEALEIVPDNASPMPEPSSQNSTSNISSQFEDEDLGDYDMLDNSLSIFENSKVKIKEMNRSQIQLKNLIGNGQYGEVFKAEYSDPYSKLNLTVAVKQSKPVRTSEHEFAENADTRTQKLLEEAFIMQQFDHPNIIKLIGICKTLPVFMVIEFCEFGDLRRYLSEIRKNVTSPENLVPVNLKLNWVIQLASALSYLENLNYVHRDVALRNLLLTTDKQIKLSDFGLSREVLNNNEYTSNSPSKWPIKWMAPESIAFYKFSTKSDVWGFAVTVWEIFNDGIKPYGSVSNGEILSLLKKGKRLELPKNCLPSLYTLMLHCWSYKPSKRPEFTQIKSKLNKILTENELIEEFDTLARVKKEEASSEKLEVQTTVKATTETKIENEPPSKDLVKTGKKLPEINSNKRISLAKDNSLESIDSDKENQVLDFNLYSQYLKIKKSTSDNYYQTATLAVQKIIETSKFLQECSIYPDQKTDDNFNQIAYKILNLAQVVNNLVDCVNFVEFEDFSSSYFSTADDSNHRRTHHQLSEMDLKIIETELINHKNKKLQLIKKSLVRDLFNTQKHLKNLQNFYNTGQSSHYLKVLISSLLPMAKTISVLNGEFENETDPLQTNIEATKNKICDRKTTSSIDKFPEDKQQVYSI